MTLYVLDPAIGQPQPALAAHSVKWNSPTYSRCITCRATGPMVRRDGEGSMLPLPHTSGCSVLEAETFQLLADFANHAAQGDGLVVGTRYPTPAELEQLSAFGHEVDPTVLVTVTTDGPLRRRCFTRTDGTVVAW